MHVREHAESVAFVHREGHIEARLLRHLDALVHNMRRIIAVNAVVCTRSRGARPAPHHRRRPLTSAVNLRAATVSCEQQRCGCIGNREAAARQRMRRPGLQGPGRRVIVEPQGRGRGLLIFKPSRPINEVGEPGALMSYTWMWALLTNTPTSVHPAGSSVGNARVPLQSEAAPLVWQVILDVA